MDPQRSASKRRQQALQKPALWCALRPPPSLLPLVMTTAMHERVIGSVGADARQLVRLATYQNKPSLHALSLLPTHALLPKHTQHTYTARNHVRRGQDLGRASNVLHPAGGRRAQQLRYVFLLPGLLAGGHLHSPHSLVVVVVESCLSLPEPVSLMHVPEIAMVLSW